MQNSSSLSGETASPMKHMNDRMMFLLANLTGLAGNITLKNGEKYTGVLSGTSLDPSEMRYVFKMVKRVQSARDAGVNGPSEATDDYVGVGDFHVMTFDIGDVADFNVSNVVLEKTSSKTPNGMSSNFRTDTDISGNMAIRERNLQRWEPSADTDVNLSLESSNTATEWDQFATNEKMFGVKSNYDESFYTTTINRSNPHYAEIEARAEKIAREIEGSSATNAHVMEERGHIAADDKGIDEEDKYSGVRRDFPPLPTGQANKYTPPARRAPTSQATVPGAPVDPAIISAQIARPGSTSSKAAHSAEATKLGTDSKAELPLPSKPEAPTDAPLKSDSQAAMNKLAEQNQKLNAALKPMVGGIPQRKPAGPPNATANVENELLDRFKEFSAAEKLRMSDRQRAISRESKAVKLNDLRKFSQNFKLHTPVPQDLVPILAKDENKQQQIVEKALRAVQELKSTPPKRASAPVDPKTVRTATAKAETTHTSPVAPADRQNNQRQRLAHNPYNSASMRNERPGQSQHVSQTPARSGTGLLSTRLALSQQQHKAGAVPYHNVPQPIPPMHDLRIPPPTGPSASSSSVQTPSSTVSARFNVKAPDFRPNPAANTFLPGSNHTSPRPRPSSAAKIEPRKVTTSFFGAQKPTGELLPLDDLFNPIKRALKEAQEQAKNQGSPAPTPVNGGIPYPFKTFPTWDFPEANKERGYLEMFERVSVTQPVPTPQAAMGNGPIPNQHQLPPHLQHGPPSGPQAQTPHHTPRHPPVQPHHGQGPHHFDGHHMQFSQSTPSVHPSPRTMPPYMYGAQPQAMPVFSQQPPMQAYGMSPGMQHAGLRQHGGPQFVNGPAPAMGGQMMANQPSNGPFMTVPANPPMQMYSPGPTHAFPHYPGQMPVPPGSSGFPSPRPGGAQMMTHQGSQQGHQPQQLMYVPPGQVPHMFPQIPSGPSRLHASNRLGRGLTGTVTPMRGPYPQPQQPHFGSPHQHNPYPQQPYRGTPSANYSQPMVQQHSMPPQAPLPAGPVNHGPEGNEEGK
ncbi:hypothetical protein GQ43DRAFT_73040 [Delitschia confertaspora ATCC 74209]|uniref:LsmAD domain-containing protein n=1 Tax=Delitschia confertaspora ATCC 74209 TaxID=1513339 RepID=A0A9P4JLL2_9PLEO|nr:hypothetical protein GQ43DRAFT_73040 [Delitschia confertaspora ATCC 74209]